jgi:hypothetical protein
MEKDALDRLLTAALAPRGGRAAADEAAAARVLERLARPLPRQRLAWWRLPAVLLDWQFMPAWPRLAALGACAALGFFIGIAGIDRSINPLYSTNAGFGAVVFEPETLTGAQP